MNPGMNSGPMILFLKSNFPQTLEKFKQAYFSFFDYGAEPGKIAAAHADHEIDPLAEREKK